MRSSVRGRFWHMGVVLLVYSCINVYSDKMLPKETESVTPYAESANDETKVVSNSNNIQYTSESPISPLDSNLTTEGTVEENHHSHPTLRPRRKNCTPPAIEQFPRPLMSPNTRKHGGLVLHVFVAIFTFLGLAIVCDDYFVSSLDRICEEFKLSPDVAGATFMAAGSSAPELATVIIGVFFAKDDIGVSGVIGSAVFNIMFVISVCALCSGTVCQLNWWPLVRDCFFYSVSILVMLMIIINDTISWGESLVMLFCYVIYCIALHFNSSLEKWAHSLKLPIKLPSKGEQSALVTYKNVPDTSYTQGQAVTSLTQDPPSKQQETSLDQGYNAYQDPNSSWDPNAAWGDTSASAPPPGFIVSNTVSSNTWDSYNSQGGIEAKSAWESIDGQKNHGYNSTGDKLDQAGETKSNLQQVTSTQPKAQLKSPDFYKSKEIKPGDVLNPLDKPTDGGLLAQIAWAIVYPIHYMCRLTMPDCRTEKYKNWYPFTFFVSMIWISFYSYFMVWMITIIGATLGVPDTVMGLTFVAAGVSVPDALSSIAVIKEGYGDMAVSNAVGSNVFDILICLGLPWFIQTAIIKPGSHVNVISKGLAYSTLSLLSTVVFLLVATHLNGWKLDKRLGVVLMFWYILFITVASLYELNVFGQMNPPECFSPF